MANTRRVETTVQASQVPSDQTGVALLLTRDNLPDEMCDPSGVNSARSDGGDIRAYINNDQTGQLNLEVVKFSHDTSTGSGDAQVELWVQSPSLVISSLTGTSIYLEYGDAAGSQPSVSEPFGRNAVWQDFVAVWHGQTTDSTGNGFTLTEVGNPTKTTNSFGGTAWSLDGSTQYVQNTSWTKVVWPLQMDAWFKNSATSGTRTFYSQGNGGWDALLNRNNSTYEINITGANSGSVGGISAQEEKVTTKFFNNVDRSIVVNGVEAVSQSLSRSQSANAFPKFNIGSLARSANDLRWQGEISEVRVKSAVDDNNLSLTEYNNQSSPSTFWLTGTPQSIGGSGLSVTGQTANYNYSAVHGSIELTGELTVTGGTANYNYTGVDGNIDLTGEIVVNGRTANYNYTSLVGSVSLQGEVNVIGNTANYNYTGVSANVSLSGEIAVLGKTANYDYFGGNATISLFDIWQIKDPVSTNWTAKDKELTDWGIKDPVTTVWSKK